METGRGKEEENEKIEKRHVRKKEVIQVKGDNREKRMTAAKTVVIVNVYPSDVKVINGVSRGNK